ncbi:HD domain-containing protein [Ascidiimonas aurantiaca]|uniref:HD domain-containing protein n=1 Tax=Ascidiimonas aurantiaca TaxID=1685432 RepID=UPI0030ED6886
MKTSNKLKILNDPIYGFITIPSALIFDLVQHPYFQRLRRISQMGLSYLVYPGAHHTRFHHALGCMHLMQKTIQVLRSKDISISKEEEEGLLIAILLHDIGHGPFSHAMEHSIVDKVNHEHISLLFMEALNTEFNGSLTLAIEIFKGEYPREFMNHLVSGQLDIDRTDYLKRDSFFTGVAEGNINTERILNMLNVFDDALVVEEKGIYSVEKFLVARRLMYWQVYLHKTSLAAEQLLIMVLKRAKELVSGGTVLSCSTALLFFLEQKIDADSFNEEALETFSKLDDYDVVAALKTWQDHSDIVLSRLCKMLLNRKLPASKLKDKPVSRQKLMKIKAKVKEKYGLSDAEVPYFVFHGAIANQAYDVEKQNIHILFKNGKIKDITAASDQLNLLALSKPVRKYFICYPKE